MNTTKQSAQQWRVDAGRHGFHIRHGKMSDPFGGDLIAQAFTAECARLIAAAPELLEALQGAMVLIGELALACDMADDSESPLMNAARAAIRKATGEQA